VSIQHQLIAVIVDRVIQVGIVKLVRLDLLVNKNCLLFFEAIVNACERAPCVHGKCFKIDFYTEICVCEKNWAGIDCSQALISER
jgi:hypothetical protein